MSKSTKNILIIVAVLFVCIAGLAGIYNSLVNKEESVSSAWSQVESVYQRRADLIPNLVKTVQGAADFEQETLNAVIEARSKASSMTIDPNALTEENIAAFQKSQGALSSSLNRLMVVVERYPDLKATQNFQELQAQLEGTENRINVERQKFNETVKTYNRAIRKFPNNMIAGMFDFEKKAYFQAEEGAEKAPEVEFDFK